MDEEKILEPEFEYWSFDTEYVEEDWRALAAWTYDGDHGFEDDPRVHVTAEIDGYLFVPPHQLFASQPENYNDLEAAYIEAVNYIENLDVEDLNKIGENQG